MSNISNLLVTSDFGIVEDILSDIRVPFFKLIIFHSKRHFFLTAHITYFSIFRLTSSPSTPTSCWPKRGTPSRPESRATAEERSRVRSPTARRCSTASRPSTSTRPPSTTRNLCRRSTEKSSSESRATVPCAAAGWTRSSITTSTWAAGTGSFSSWWTPKRWKNISRLENKRYYMVGRKWIKFFLYRDYRKPCKNLKCRFKKALFICISDLLIKV